MQRGTTLELNLTGTNLSSPTGLWTSFPARVTIPTDNNNGQDNTKLRVQLEVPRDAPLGFHSIRLATTRGISNARLFCIDDLPQVLKADGNRTKNTAQVVPVSCVVVGRIDTEASDYYKITVPAGQQLSFEVLGRRLGSALDPQISLYDPHTGRELPGGHSNDAPGCQTDPRLSYTFKEAGDYLIEVRDVMHRGGLDFWYRLRIGDFPCATAPVPMAARRGSKTMITFAGTHVDGVAPVEVTVPEDPIVDTLYVIPKGPSGLSGWPVGLAVSPIEEAVEQEPNNEPANANRLTVPGGITGRFLEKEDIDHFVFTAKKGQRYVIEAQTFEYGSPTFASLVLRNAMGSQVAAVIEPATTPRIDFTAPADGDFILAVDHLNRWFGPAESYRVTVQPQEPGFDLTVGLDRFDLAKGGVLGINVQAARRDYNGPIDVSVLGSAGLSGQATIPAGRPSAVLLLHAQPDAALSPHGLLLQGKGTINGKPVVDYVSVRTHLTQSFGNLTFPPRTLFHQVALAVTEQPPFTLAAKFDHAEAVRGLPASVTISVNRIAGFTEEVALTAVGLPPNVTAALKKIPKDQAEVKVQLNVAANAALGPFTVGFQGKAKFQNMDYGATALAESVVVALPFSLKVEPAPVTIAQGGKASVKVTAVRMGGYLGPISLEVRNLPANVTAPKATIPMGQDAVDIELTAAADAAAGAKADVNVQGTATAAANQQSTSPNFTVSVQEK
jgi:hypothetical protein